jgi:probable poly-beta-1,6-N-acetyl-D-glucosamine export protein
VKKDFLSYIHNYRGLAILLILCNHCRTAFAWPKDSVVNDFLTFSVDSPTILFVFISGFLFQHLNSEKFEYGSYLKKKTMYVMLPYVLVSIPALLDKLMFETDAAWMSPFYKSLYPPFQVIYMLCTGKHSGPFYFIPMVGIVFLLSPLLVRLQKSNYFSIITAIIVSIGLFTFAYGFYGTILESLTYFLPIYIFGIWVSKNRNLILGMSNYIIYALIAFYSIILFLKMTHLIHTEHLTYFNPFPTYLTSHFNWSKLQMMALAIIILVLFYKVNKKSFRLLYWLGSASFGIYFIHIYFINVAERLLKGVPFFQYQTAISYALFTTMIVCLSAVAVLLVKKIFKQRSRFLIGS